VLRWLEVLNNGYEYVRKLVSGRYALIALMSFGAWVLEGGLLFFIAGVLGIPFDAGDFSDYITSILSTAHSELQGKYTWFSIIVMAIFTVPALAAALADRNRYRSKQVRSREG
jgi:hypothetical protein